MIWHESKKKNKNKNNNFIPRYLFFFKFLIFEKTHTDISCFCMNQTNKKARMVISFPTEFVFAP